LNVPVSVLAAGCSQHFPQYGAYPGYGTYPDPTYWPHKPAYHPYYQRAKTKKDYRPRDSKHWRYRQAKAKKHNRDDDDDD